MHNFHEENEHSHPVKIEMSNVWYIFKYYSLLKYYTYYIMFKTKLIQKRVSYNSVFAILLNYWTK